MKLLLLLAFVASAYSAYFEPGDLNLECSIGRPVRIKQFKSVSNSGTPVRDHPVFSNVKSVISSWNFNKDDCCKFSLMGHFSSLTRTSNEYMYVRNSVELDWISFNIGVHPENPCKYKAKFRFDPNRIVLRGHGRKPGEVIDPSVGYDGFIDEASCTHIKIVVEGDIIRIRSSTCPYAIDITYGRDVGRVLQKLNIYVHDKYDGQLTGLCGASYDSTLFAQLCFSDLEPGKSLYYPYHWDWTSLCSTTRAYQSCENSMTRFESLKCIYSTPGNIDTYDGSGNNLRNRNIWGSTVISQWNKNVHDCCKFSVQGSLSHWTSNLPGDPSEVNVLGLFAQLNWIEIRIGVHPTDKCKNAATVMIDPSKVLLTRLNMAAKEIDMNEGFYGYVDAGKCTHIHILRYHRYILVRSNTCPYAMYIRRDDERISDAEIYVDQAKYAGDLDGICRDGDGSVFNDEMSCFTPGQQPINYGDWIDSCSTAHATQYCQTVNA